MRIKTSIITALVTLALSLVVWWLSGDPFERGKSAVAAFMFTALSGAVAFVLDNTDPEGSDLP